MIKLTLAQAWIIYEYLIEMNQEYVSYIIGVLRNQMIRDYVINKYYDDTLGKVHRIAHNYNCGPTYHDCKGKPTVDPQEDVDIEVIVDGDDWLTCLTVWAYEKSLIEHDDVIQFEEDKGWVFVAIDSTDEQIPDLIKQIIEEIKKDVNNVL